MVASAERGQAALGSPLGIRSAPGCLCSQLVEDRGFPETLRDMVSDPNPMVVANAVAALAEIQEASGQDMMHSLGPMAQSKLLAAVNECTEWGQVFILDALAKLVPASQQECRGVIERGEKGRGGCV